MRDELARLERDARIARTRCGDGRMIWRSWGEGAPLVLLHGGGGSWQHWIRNVAHLAADREVWCPDLPSFGDSATAPPPSDVHAIARVAADGLEEVAGSRRPLDVVGFSFGGLVATLIAREKPGLVGRLVVVGSTSLGIPRLDLAMRSWRSLADPGERLAAHRANLRTLMLAHHGDDDSFAVDLHARNVERARFNGRATARTTLLRDSLAGIGARVHGIWGSLDATALPDVRAAERAMRAATELASFDVIDDAGHWVQYEAAERFHDVLRRVLVDVAT